MKEGMTYGQCEKIIIDHCKNPKKRCEGCALVSVALRLLELLPENRTKKADRIKKEMAIKAHNDTMRMGQPF